VPTFPFTADPGILNPTTICAQKWVVRYESDVTKYVIPQGLEIASNMLDTHLRSDQDFYFYDYEHSVPCFVSVV